VSEISKFMKKDLSNIARIMGVPKDNLSKIIKINMPAATPSGGDRGIFGGGSGAAFYNIIDFITISTTGNANDFGDLTIDRRWADGTDNGYGGDKGVIIAGRTNTPSNQVTNTIDYITMSTESNASDFGGILSGGKRSNFNSTSNKANDRGLAANGIVGGIGDTNSIEYITISSSANSNSFGECSSSILWRYGPSAISNGSNNRALFAGGIDGGGQSVTIEYVNISSTGNSSDFGDLTAATDYVAGTSNTTNNRGVFGGGQHRGNIIDYVTISTTGNAADFGDLLVGGHVKIPTSNGINNRGVWAGGGSSNVIEYITIISLSNSVDFGDLTEGREGGAGLSNTD
jgi:hypothetical protein